MIRYPNTVAEWIVYDFENCFQTDGDIKLDENVGIPKRVHST